MAGAVNGIPPSIGSRFVRPSSVTRQAPTAHAHKRAGGCTAETHVRRRRAKSLGLPRLRPAAWRACSGAAGARVRIQGGRYSGRSHRC